MSSKWCHEWPDGRATFSKARDIASAVGMVVRTVWLWSGRGLPSARRAVTRHTSLCIPARDPAAPPVRGCSPVRSNLRPLSVLNTWPQGPDAARPTVEQALHAARSRGSSSAICRDIGTELISSRSHVSMRGGQHRRGRLALKSHRYSTRDAPSQVAGSVATSGRRLGGIESCIRKPLRTRYGGAAVAVALGLASVRGTAGRRPNRVSCFRRTGPRPSPGPSLPAASS
jgi:hypothetical protein